MLAGLGSILITIIAYLNPRVRNIESNIPDVVADAPEQPEPRLASVELSPATE